MERIYPESLTFSSEVRVIAPSRSLAIISQDNRSVANGRFKDLGIRISYASHAEEMDDFTSSPIGLRVDDIHEAFSDKNVKGVLSVIGGFNSNQLLRYLDWNLIANNPKIFCGFSDITALNNSILAKTGLVTYSGPHYSTFGQKLDFDYTNDYFKKCLFSKEAIDIVPSKSWSDDEWYKNQEVRSPVNNEGWLVINGGTAEGVILGANLSTFNLLQGTEYFPDLNNSILFLEDYEGTNPEIFDRDLQSLIHLPNFAGVKGIVIGRFQKVSQVSNEKLSQIIKTKRELNGVPVIANVDFGHTDPKITFPIGGTCKLEVTKDRQLLQILEH
jgi:muramoyltetrapeptide carboxypeptidase